MEESKVKSGSASSSTLPSRLSPLALPFAPHTAYNSSPLDDWQHVSPTGSLLKSLDTSYGFCGDHQFDTSFGVFPYDCHSDSEFEPISSFYGLYPAENFRGLGDFAVIGDSFKFSSQLDYSQKLSGIGEQTKIRDYKGSFCYKGNPNGGGSTSEGFDNFLTEGKHTAEGMGPCGQTTDTSPKKSSGILGRDNQISSKGALQMDAGCLSFSGANSRVTPLKFPTSSDLSSTAGVKDIPQTQLPYAAPVMTWSQCNPNITLADGQFFQFASDTAKPTDSHSLNNNSFAPLISGPSTATTAFSLDPVFLKDVDSSGNHAIDKNESSGYIPSSTNEPRFPLNVNRKEFHLKKSQIDKGGERRNGKLTFDEDMDPSFMGNSKLQITRPSFPEDFTLELPAAGGAIHIQNSPIMLDDNNSELDSPCWKGTLTSCQSPFSVPGPLTSQILKDEPVACSSLNPLAPQFIPGNGKQGDNCHETECIGDNSSSFQRSVSLALKAGSCALEVSNVIGTQCSNEIHEPEKENHLLNNSINCSMVNSSHMVQPCPVEDYFTSKGSLVAGANVEGFVNDINDTAPNGSSAVPFLAAERILSPSSEVSFHSDFTETLRDLSLSTPPKLDVQMVVNAMHNLSKLLVQKCSNDLDSLNEHDHDIIRSIINNLYVCSRNRVLQKTPMPELTQPSSSYCPMKSTDFYKSLNMECHVARTEAMSVPHTLVNWNERQNSGAMYSEKAWDFFLPSSDAGIKKGYDIIQVINNGGNENCQIKEEMHPQAVLYRNLWLEAEAALRYMKYKASLVQMIPEVNRCKSD